MGGITGGLGVLEHPSFHMEHTRKSPQKHYLRKQSEDLQNLFCLFYFSLLIFDIFILKWPKLEEFSFLRVGGLVPEATISTPLNFTW